MTDAIDRFDELAGEYDEFTDAMPNYREMNETMLELFETWDDRNSTSSICELGCGTGTVTRTLVEEFQPEKYVAIDGATNMVEQAIERFADYTGPTHVRFEQRVFEEWNPEETFDVVYSSLALHHMTDPDKRNLYNTVIDVLEPGGLFLYVDLFDPPERLSDFYYDINRRRRLALGMSEEEFEERWQSHLENDRPSQWQDTLHWLNDTGFATVDCGWKNGNRAIWLAVRGTGSR